MNNAPTVYDATKDFILSSAAAQQNSANPTSINGDNNGSDDQQQQQKNVAVDMSLFLVPAVAAIVESSSQSSVAAAATSSLTFAKTLYSGMYYEDDDNENGEKETETEQQQQQDQQKKKKNDPSYFAKSKEKLDSAKRELDNIPDSVYYVTRDRLFPLAHSGANPAASRFQNRAGHKLNETMEATGTFRFLISAVTTTTTTTNKNKNAKHPAPGAKAHNAMKLFKKKDMAFVDVCGGPGAFSQALFASCPKALRFKGFGLTLMDKHVGAPEGWYPELRQRHDFSFTFGVDGTGNIYKTENLHALRTLVRDFRPLLVVADGGFEVPPSQAAHQEVISSRIVFSQWLSALMLLQAKGCFVLKLFDVFSPFSHSLLFLSTLVFEKVHIVKPRHSRVVNSERYLACLGYKPGVLNQPFVPPSNAATGQGGDKKGSGSKGKKKSAAAAAASKKGAATVTCLEHLINMHTHGFDDVSAMRSVVPLEAMEQDEVFQASLRVMIEEVATRQITALRMILDSDILKDKMAAIRRLEQADGQHQQQPQQPPQQLQLQLQLQQHDPTHAADAVGERGTTEHERKRERRCETEQEGKEDEGREKEDEEQQPRQQEEEKEVEKGSQGGKADDGEVRKEGTEETAAEAAQPKTETPVVKQEEQTE